MPGPANIGDRVRDLRLSKRLSQAQLAGRELSNSYISLIESGKRRPTPEVVRLLADRLSCTPEFLLEGIEPGQHAHLQVRLRHAELALQAGDYDKAIENFGQVSTDGDDPDLVRRARWGSAHALEAAGHLEEAITLLEELREEAEQEPASRPWLPVCVALCRCYSAVGDLSRAVELGEEALGRLDRLGLTTTAEAAELGAVMVCAHHVRGDFVRSRDIGQRLSVATEAIGGDIIDTTYWQASQRALTEGSIGDALYLADRALETRAHDQELKSRALLQLTYARTLLSAASQRLASLSGADGLAALGTSAQADVDEALASLRTAAPIFDGRDALACQVDIARAMVLLGKPQDAAKAAESAANELTRLDDPEAEIEIGRAHMVCAHARLAEGEPVKAVQILRIVGTQLAGIQPSRSVARTWRELGDLFGRAGDDVEMTKAYRQALECTGVRPVTRPEASRLNLATR